MDAVLPGAVDGSPDERTGGERFADSELYRSMMRWRAYVDQLQRIHVANADQQDPVFTLSLVANTAASFLGATSVELYLADPSNGTVRRVAGVGMSSVAGLDHRLDALAEDVVHGDPLRTVDGLHASDCEAFAVPMSRQRQPIGAVVLAWDGAAPAIDPLEVAFLKMLAAAATVAVNQANSARLIEESARLIEQSAIRARAIAEFDPLTGLVNRAAAQGRLDEWDAPNPPAVIAIDLDRFRVINEAHGMWVGDEVLRGVADRLRSATRVDDLIARVAGDEFVLVVEALSQGQVSDVADRVQQALAVPVTVGGDPLPLTASVGTAIARAGDPSEVVLLNADLARARAKQLGGAQVVHFDAALRTASFETATLERDLGSAITDDQFEVLFQPLVTLPERELAGAEVLLRWHHPTRGLLTPDTFMPIAEANGQIQRIDQLVMAQAVAQIREWDAAGSMPPAFRVSVNVSADRFRDRDFVETIISDLAGGGLEDRLRIELTETVVMGDEARAVEVINELHAVGVHVSLDDFGTGWSSLAYLKRFPVDALKVDRAFVDDIADDPDDRAIVAVILQLAANLGLRVLAEGIETEEQEAVLVELGCRYGQGFLYDRPQPAAAFRERWLAAVNPDEPDGSAGGTQ